MLSVSAVVKIIGLEVSNVRKVHNQNIIVEWDFITSCTKRRAGAFSRCTGGSFVLKIAGSFSVVFRQYRLPPCPPPEPAHSQLPFEKMFRINPGATSETAVDICKKSVLCQAKFVG